MAHLFGCLCLTGPLYGFKKIEILKANDCMAILAGQLKSSGYQLANFVDV